MKNRTKSLTLSSDFEEVQRIESFVDELQDWISFDDDIYGNVMLAVSEAVTNAIIHGNKQDSDKKVHVKAQQQHHKLTITIKDEGEGFDPSLLPDPLKDENLLREGGRGVYLIEQFADKVVYSEGGTKVTVEFEV